MTNNIHYDHLSKILILGSPLVGKTDLVKRFVENKCDLVANITRSIDYYIKYLDIDGKRIKLQIVDTAGKDSVRSIVASYIPGAYGFILAYDITDEKGLEKLPSWIDLIKNHSVDDTPIILVATKCDLEDERKVTTAQGQHFADEIGLHFWEVSAYDDVNVVEAFTDIVRAALQFKSDVAVHKVNNDTHIQLDSENKTQSKHCF